MHDRLTGKVLLIGWDAADWNHIRPLLDRGLMPTLKRLMQRGVWGQLATLQPMLSPMLWNSIATGKRPSKHGILGFTEVAPDGQSIRPVASTSRKCKALWNIATQNNLDSLVVGWYASHPAEPIRGVCVSNQFEQPAGPLDKPWPVPEGAVHPARLTDELAALRVHPHQIQADAIAQFMPNLRSVPDWSNIPRIGKLQALIAQSASIHAVATHLLTTQNWNLAAFYYEGIDRFGHEFGHYHPPRMPSVDAAEFELFKDVMTGCYAFHDMMLEALLRAAGDDATVMLISDHGYALESHRPENIADADPTDWHRPFGIACCAGPGFKSGERLYGASLLDVAPTALQLLGLPHGADMDGRPWVEVFDRAIQVDRVPSWDHVPGDAGAHPPDLQHDPHNAVQVMKQFVALGYIAPLSDDLEKSIEQTNACNDLNLALSYMDARQPQLAEPILVALHERERENTGLALQLALCYAAMGKVADARSLAERLAGASSPHPRALILLSALDLADNQIDSALARLGEAEKLAPNTGDIQSRIGSVYLKAGKFDQAKAAFERALKADPTPPAYDGLAEVFIGLQQYEPALDAALEAVSLSHHFPRAHFHLGQALAALGQTERAIDALSLATRQAPSYPQAHRLLADVLRRAGQTRRAADHDFLAAGGNLPSR